MHTNLILRIVASIAVLFCHLCAAAAQVDGSLTSGTNPTHADYNYSAYWLTPAPNTELRVVLRSKTFDAYLLAISPDGPVLRNDDHDLAKGAADLRSTDAAIVAAKPASGRWLVIATSLDIQSQGAFVLEYPGTAQLEPIPAGQLPRPSIAAAFAARGVQDPAVRRDALYDQLTLESFRSDMRQRLLTEIARLERSTADSGARLGANVARQKLLTDSSEALKASASSLGIVSELIKKEEDRLVSEAKQLNDRLLAGGRDRIALSQALTELDLVGTISNAIKSKEDGLVLQQAAPVQEELRSELVRLRAERETIGKALAEKMLKSRVVTERRFSVSSFSRDDPLSVSTLGGLASLRASSAAYDGASADLLRQPLAELQPHNATEARVSRGLVLSWAGIASGRPETQREPAIDSQVWLPAMLPWPPPTPSSRMVLDRSVLVRGGHNDVRTLGQVESVMRTALGSAGYSDASYWGVPRGFAIVTPLEQTNDKGAPLVTPARWVKNIVEMKSFSLAEYLRALFTAPPGHFRVLVFVVSSQAFGASDAREVLETLERWSAKGLNFLPDRVRTESFTDEHHVTVLVYEFLKKVNNDKPATSYPGRLKVPDHLKATKLAALLQ